MLKYGLTLLALTLALPVRAQFVTLQPEAPRTSFGIDVALSSDGSTALVGAFSDDHGHPDTSSDFGAAFVFVRVGRTWHQQAKLVAPVPQERGSLGYGVALSADGHVALVSAPDETLDGARRGAIYVFTRSGQAWTLRDQLRPPGTDTFSGPVALSADGETALFGSTRPTVEGSQGSGSVWHYEAETWTKRATLLGDTDTFIGGEVALSADGTTALLGTPDLYCAGICTLVNASYIFRKSDSVWNREARITDASATEAFGRSVSLSDHGDVALIGDPLAGRGHAYIYERDESGAWSETASFRTPDDGFDTSYFGRGGALNGSGTLAVVGGIGRTQPGFLSVYARGSEGWSHQRMLRDPDGGSGNFFGSTLDVSQDGRVLLVGDAGEDGIFPSGGAAYVLADPTVRTEPLPSSVPPITFSVRPHPATPDATVHVVVPHTQHVRLLLHDPLGRRVAQPHAGVLPAGIHRLPLGASPLPAGVYVLTLQTDRERVTERVVIAP